MRAHVGAHARRRRRPAIVAAFDTERDGDDDANG
jgi:hypothetical protein